MELTREHIKEAIKNIKENKKCVHNFEHSGFCPYCGLMWLGKEDGKNIKKLLKNKDKTK